MDQQEQSLIDRIKQAQNVLVTVSNNPSVDQLAAAIGLTVALNKLDKHGTAVFSGQVPSTLEFLKPEETLEKNTDSLRDFIIALDKSKADKLRYKVEDQVVRIFITPYKTSLSQNDLEFTQGDFNVDVVVALGVSEQQDIDTAITAHGRILHDATVTSISMLEGNSLGTINWVDTGASSLSEMMLGLIDGLDKKLLDNQIATALLTGIVASTDRFRNEKTTPKAMSASAELMAAGANQQLIASELETPQPDPEPEPEPEPAAVAPQDEGVPESDKKPEPGELDINHEDDKEQHDGGDQAGPAEAEVPPKEEQQPQIHVDENGMLRSLDDLPPVPPQISEVHGVQADGNAGGASKVHHERLEEPPMLGDASLTANTSPDEDDEPAEEQYALPKMQPLNAPLLKHNESVLPASEPVLMNSNENPFIPQSPLQPAPANWQPPEPPKPAPFEPPAPPAPLPEPPVSATPAPEPIDMPAPVPMPPAPVLAPMPEPPAAAAVPIPPPPPAPLPPAPAAFTNPFAPPTQPAFTPPPITPPAPPAVPMSGPRPDETLDQIEKDVNSPHLQAVASASSVDDARSAVEAALKDAGAPAGPDEPIVALNAQPLGPELHPAMPLAPDTQLPPPPAPASPPPPINAGFSESTPGNTPADATLDMPLPSNPFGPGQQPSMPPAPAPAPLPPPSSFPGNPPPMPGVQGGQTPPPPVPPPLLPPV